MTELEQLASIVGSRRLARDLIDGWDRVLTRPWWPIRIDISKREPNPKHGRETRALIWKEQK